MGASTPAKIADPMSIDSPSEFSECPVAVARISTPPINLSHITKSGNKEQEHSPHEHPPHQEHRLGAMFGNLFASSSKEMLDHQGWNNRQKRGRDGTWGSKGSGVLWRGC